MADKIFLSADDIFELYPAVAANWTTLSRRQANEGFPPGHMVGRRRIWTVESVKAWLEAQPTENNAPLRGYAKQVARQ